MVQPDAKKSNRWIFGTMLFFAFAGLLASFVLSIEKLELLKNPDAALSCNISVILNCASVMKTWQATLFGFPNSFIGMMAYPVVITLAVAGLSGVKFPRKFMVAAQIGFTLGLIFSYWLFFQSVYVIQVLCPWCLIVTVATTILFEALLRYNIRENNFKLSPKINTTLNGWLAKEYDKFATVAWLALLAGLVFLKFPDVI